MPDALARLCRLLHASPDVSEVRHADGALAALPIITHEKIDVVFLDIAMPGLSGTELAAMLRRMTDPPAVVFVTAFDRHAVAAFDLDAADFLLKPVREERLAEALRKVLRYAPAPAPSRSKPVDPMPVIPVEVDGGTLYVRREDVFYVEAQRDYIFLHARSGKHKVRIPLSRVADMWEGAGFVRSHRSFIVSTAAVIELITDTTGTLFARTEVGLVPVSRRFAGALKDHVLRAVEPSVDDER